MAGTGILAAALALSGAAFPHSAVAPTLPMARDLGSVAPALERYGRDTLAGKLWTRPGLSVRDRGLVTVAALIARGQTADLPDYLRLALDAGVKPSEVSGLITHLAFYAGWANAMPAVPAAQAVFAERGLRVAPPPMESLPFDEEADRARAASVDAMIGSSAPALARDTTEVLFRDLWLRPDLTPRDRSLVTVSALIATGQSGQLAGHLTRALHNGLTQAEASEVISHLAYYGGWPNAFSAAAIARAVFEHRSAPQ